MYQHKIILFFIFYFILSGISFSQGDLVSINYINQFLKHSPEYAKVQLTIDDSTAFSRAWLGTPNFNKSTKMTLRDSFGNFYVSPGEYEAQFFFDSDMMVWYHQPFKLAVSEERTFNLDSKLFYKNFDPEKMLVEQLAIDDTLTWIQQSDNSWFYVFDTLTIIQKTDHKLLHWTYHKKGKISQKIEKSFVLNKEQETELIRIETILYYPETFKKTNFKYCGDCRGTQSVHSITSGHYKKYYMDPTCEQAYWWAFRQSFLQHE